MFAFALEMSHSETQDEWTHRERILTIVEHKRGSNMKQTPTRRSQEEKQGRRKTNEILLSTYLNHIL